MSVVPGVVASGVGTSAFDLSEVSDKRLWLKQGVYTLDGSGNVSQWDDQSGKAHHPSQGSGTARPTPTAEGAVEFTAATDYLVIPHHADLQMVANMHMWAVVEDTGTETAVTPLGKFAGGSAAREWIFQLAGTSATACRLLIYDGTSTNNNVTGGNCQDGAIHLMHGFWDGSNLGIQRDDDATTTKAVASAQTSIKDVWVGGYEFAGQAGIKHSIVHEVFMAVESDPDVLADIDSYFADKFGVAV